MIVRFRLFLITCLLLCGCTTSLPRTDITSSLVNDQGENRIKVVTVPLPVIASSPNEGITYGALTAFLLHNQKDEVTTLIAPQVNENRNFGTTFSLYGAWYPSSGESWEMNLSKSTRINEDYEIKYLGHPFEDRRIEISGFLYRFTDGSARFFGFHSSSSPQNETNYADGETGLTLSVGYEIIPHLQAVVGERVRRVTITRGAVSGIPFTRDVFSTTAVPGVDGFTAHTQRLALVYSTLDAPSLPSSGIYGKLGVETSFERLGNDTGYRRYEAEVKGFLPLQDGRYISVFRALYQQTLGDSVPFLERSTLGGENSLRGYGRNRFIDSSCLLFNLEERIRLFRWRVFNVNADWEAAPFIDFGAVMKSLDELGASNFEFNPGLGLRAVVRPNIVGRIDIGLGNEGPAVFVGLGYPF